MKFLTERAKHGSHARGLRPGSTNKTSKAFIVSEKSAKTLRGGIRRKIAVDTALTKELEDRTLLSREPSARQRTPGVNKRVSERAGRRGSVRRKLAATRILCAQSKNVRRRQSRWVDRSIERLCGNSIRARDARPERCGFGVVVDALGNPLKDTLPGKSRESLRNRSGRKVIKVRVLPKPLPPPSDTLADGRRSTPTRLLSLGGIHNKNVASDTRCVKFYANKTCHLDGVDGDWWFGIVSTWRGANGFGVEDPGRSEIRSRWRG